MMGNIGRMFDLAADSPQDLVMAFEIIEMQHEYNERRNNAMRNALKNGGLSNVHQREHEDVRALVEENIRRMLDEKVSDSVQ